MVRAGGCARSTVSGYQDRKSTRLNSSHSQISYAVFCLKKKKNQKQLRRIPRKLHIHIKNQSRSHNVSVNRASCETSSSHFAFLPNLQDCSELSKRKAA